MGEEQMRADMAAQVAQVLVRPGRPHLAIEAGLASCASYQPSPKPSPLVEALPSSARMLCTTSEWAGAVT